MRSSWHLFRERWLKGRSSNLLTSHISKPGLNFLVLHVLLHRLREERFRKTRRKRKEYQVDPPRTNPTPQTYREYLQNTGQLADETTRGGLYWRYTAGLLP